MAWLKSSNLPAATEGLVVAAQDKALRTRYYERNILHRDVSPACRLCNVRLETVDHVVAGCSALPPMDYSDRHNQVASIIHWNICRHFRVPVEIRWHRHHLIGLWRRTTSLRCAIQPSLMLGRSVPIVYIFFRNKKTNSGLPISAHGNITGKQPEKFDEIQ